MISRRFVVLYRGSTCSDCLFWLKLPQSRLKIFCAINCFTVQSYFTKIFSSSCFLKPVTSLSLWLSKN